MKSAKSLLKTIVPGWAFRLRWERLRRRQAAAAGLKLCINELYIDLERAGLIVRLGLPHKVYLEHVIENFDFFGDSVQPVLHDGRLLVDMSGPRYHKLKGFDSIPFLFPSLTEPYGTTEDYLDFAKLEAGDIVLDLGAYSGVTSICFAEKVGPSGHVYGFEADAVNHSCAAENISMAKRWMGLENITLVNRAVWEHEDGVKFSTESAMGSGAVEITGSGRGREAMVPSVTLETFCGQMGLDRLDFVKMDIEGAELKVLRHSAGFLGRMKTRLVIEPHSVNGVVCTKECCGFLQAAGYGFRLQEQVGGVAPLILAEIG